MGKNKDALHHITASIYHRYQDTNRCPGHELIRRLGAALETSEHATQGVPQALN